MRGKNINKNVSILAQTHFSLQKCWRNTWTLPSIRMSHNVKKINSNNEDDTTDAFKSGYIQDYRSVYLPVHLPDYS